MLQLRVSAGEERRRVARTAVYLGQRAVSRGDAWVRELPERHLHDHVQLLDFLGAGVYGAAFTCNIDPWFDETDLADDEKEGWRQRVIKLSPSRLRRDDLLHLSGRAKREYVKQVFGKKPDELLRGTEQEEPDQTHQREQAGLAFCKEVQNAELLLEPKLLRQYRYNASAPPKEDEESRGWRMWRLVGTPVRGLTEAQRLRVSADQHTMRAHPGFHHMHRVLHLDRSLPAIISEKADGDLLFLRKKIQQQVHGANWLTLVHGKPPPALWVRICAQLAAAFEYMGAHSNLSHVDLKPENVLFQWGSSGSEWTAADENKPLVKLRCMLSDYGICAAHSETIDKRKYFPGTSAYNPHHDNLTDWQRQKGTMRQLSAFQFATTALDLLCFDHHHPCQYRERGEVIADLFNRPSPPANNIKMRPEGDVTLSLVRIVTASKTSLILLYMNFFIQHIKEAARVLNAGIPYYTTDVRERCKREQDLADGARAALHILNGWPRA
jgi:serine/threonine protein kinase